MREADKNAKAKSLGRQKLAFGGVGAVVVLGVFAALFPSSTKTVVQGIIDTILDHGNPPVIIVGACIHGTFDQTNTHKKGVWNKVTDQVEYNAVVPNNTMLQFKNVVDETGRPVDKMSLGPAWVIDIVDRQSNGKPQNYFGAQLCPDQRCTGKPESSKIVYFQIVQHSDAPQPDTSLEYVVGSNELHFHSYSYQCGDVRPPNPGSSKEDKACDFLYKFTVSSMPGKTYYCGNYPIPAGSCSIHVGK